MGCLLILIICKLWTLGSEIMFLKSNIYAFLFEYKTRNKLLDKKLQNISFEKEMIMQLSDLYF